MTVSDWLIKTPMTAVRSLAIILVFVVLMFGFGGVSCHLMLDKSADHPIYPKVVDAAIITAVNAAAQTREGNRQDKGKNVMEALLYLLAVAIGANAASQFGDRATSREKYAAQEHGRITGLAAASQLATMAPPAANGTATVEVDEAQGVKVTT